MRGQTAGRARHRMYFSLFYFLCLLSFPFLSRDALGRRGTLEYCGRLCRSRAGYGHLQTTPLPLRQPLRQPWPFGPHVGGDQMERAKAGETTIRMRERNGERDLVGKHSRGDLILVKEKGRLAAIYTLMPLACHQSVSFLQGCLPYRRPKEKAVSHRLAGNQKKSPRIIA